MSFFKKLFRSKIEEVKDWQDPNREVNPVTCKEFTIEGVTPALYVSFLCQAKAAGVEFEGNLAEIDGIKLDFNYDPTIEVIHITPIKHPFYVGCDQIQSHIQKIVDKSKGGI